MNNNFNPLSAEELTSRINKIPRVNLAQLPTVLEFAPNISKELGIKLPFICENGSAIYNLNLINSTDFVINTYSPFHTTVIIVHNGKLFTIPVLTVNRMRRHKDKELRNILLKQLS